MSGSTKIIIGMCCILIPLQLHAADWEPVAGNNKLSDGITAGLVAGDSIICEAGAETTIIVDTNSPALGGDGQPAIVIAGGTQVTIEFEGASKIVLGNGDHTSITIETGSSLTVTNAGGATGYFDFSANDNKILSINGPVTGADEVNTFVMDNNTLRTQTSPVTLNQVTMGGPDARIDVNVATTIIGIDGTTGKVVANADLTVEELTVSPGVNQTFTWTGTGSATVTQLNPITVNNGSFTKTGAGRLLVAGGFDFGGAMGVKLIVEEGEFIDAGGAAIVFGDSAERIVVGEEGVYTTSSNLTGHTAGINLDTAAVSTVNFTRAGQQILLARSDENFRMLGTVNIDNGTALNLTGAYRYQFGHVNVKAEGELINHTPGSTMLFTPDSMLMLEGNGGGALSINGQSAADRITMNTTTGLGNFVFNRRRSTDVTFQYVTLGNCIYTSLGGGLGADELELFGVVDGGNNVNWFSALAADAGPDKTIMIGDSVVLDGAAAGASGNYSYLWSPAVGLDDPTVRNPEAAPSADQIYTLTVTDMVDPALTASDTVTVTVVPQIVVDAGPNRTVIAGGSVQLQGAATGGSGQYAYEWIPNVYLSNSLSPTPICTPLQSITYTLSVTDTVLEKTLNDTVTITVSGSGGVNGGICGLAGGAGLMLTFLGLVGLRRSRCWWR